MKINIYNQKGEKTSTLELPKEVFGVEVNNDLIHQIIVSQRANKRQGNAHTKDRSEARGGGRRPWRQKGTGRARHSSIRSPIWTGGGVTFGPRNEKVFSKRIPKKMRRKALFMILTSKAQEKSIVVLDKIELKESKTKLMAQLISNLRKNIKELEKGSILIALPNKSEDLVRAGRNIPKVQMIQAKDLSPLQAMNFKHILMPKESINVIKQTFVK